MGVNAKANGRLSQLLWHSLMLTAVVGLLGPATHAQVTSVHISQLGHTAWRLEDGLFGGAPTTITQTQDGYIWVGTQAGLYRFDGARFVPFATLSGKALRSPMVTSLLAAKDGSLWIGTASLLEHWKDGEVDEYLDQLGYIGAIAEDANRNIWITRQHVSSPTGPLCKVAGLKLSCYGKDSGIPFSNAGPLLLDGAGGLWVATAHQLEHWKNGAVLSTYAPPGLSKSENLDGFSTIITAPDHSVLAGMVRSGNGLGLQHFTENYWQPFTSPSFDSSSLELTTAMFDRQQSLWVGTVSQGIYLMRGSQIDTFTSADGLSSNSVNAMFQDREGNVWVATTKGLDKFRQLPILTFSDREGLRGDHVNAVLASSAGSVRLANGNALETLAVTRGNPSVITDAQTGHEITALLEDRSGNLWSGVDNGIVVRQGNAVRKITDPQKRVLGPVISLQEDHDGSVWALGIGNPSRLIHITNFVVSDITAISGLYAILADEKEGLWFGLSSGDLGRFRNGHVQTIAFHRPPHVGVINRIVSAGDEYVLASTSSGIIGFNNNRTQILNVNDGLPCARAYSLVFDARQNLWLSMACGIISVAPDELERWWKNKNYKISVHTYSNVDGAQPSQAAFQPTASLSADGTVWFANSTVLQSVDTANLKVNTLPPPVHIEGVFADQKSYGSASGIRVPPVPKDIQIDYTALSFVVPQRVQFRYKLEGFDSSWQDVGDRRQAFYTGLRPGNYRFVVVASNNDGIWNTAGADVSFTVQPAVYQTWWFELLCGVVLASFASLLYAYRVQRIKAQVQERLSTRLAERERIARDLHDTLLQGFQGLILRFQSVAKTMDPSSPNGRLMESVMSRADQVLIEGRQKVCELRAKSSEPLSERLSGVLREMEQTSESAFALTMIGTPRDLEPMAYDEIYGITREALANAFLHAKAERIEVDIIYGDSDLQVRVRDDGIGIAEQTLAQGKTDHWGLQGMRERARSLGGELQIWSHPGAGTEVELKISSNVAYVQRHEHPNWLKKILKRRSL